MDCRYHSRMHFTPGELQLCGCPVCCMEWETPYPASEEAMWTILERLPAPAKLTPSAFLDLLREYPPLHLTHVRIKTETCDAHIFPATHEINLSFTSGYSTSLYLKNSDAGNINATVSAIDNTLYLIDATSEESIRNRLAKMRLLGVTAEQISH